MQQWVAFFRWRYPALAAIVSFSTQAVMYTEAELKEIRGYKKAPKRLLKKATTVGADALMDALAGIPIPGKSIDWGAAKDAIRAYQETKGQAFQPAAQAPARRAAVPKSAVGVATADDRLLTGPSVSVSGSASSSTAPPAIAAAEFDFEALAAEADAEEAAGSEVSSGKAPSRLNADDDEDDDDDDEADSDNDGDEKVQAAIQAHLATLQLGCAADGSAADASGAAASMITVGLIGHPNVGKSSLINGMVSRHVVSTSRTPGHTKYYQHIPITRELRLMDCPGLVFPAADVPKALQVQRLIKYIMRRCFLKNMFFLHVFIL